MDDENRRHTIRLEEDMQQVFVLNVFRSVERDDDQLVSVLQLREVRRRCVTLRRRARLEPGVDETVAFVED